MGLLYDITKDYLYQEGREAEKRENMAKMLVKQKLSIEEIVDLFEFTVTYVEAVAGELKQ